MTLPKYFKDAVEEGIKRTKENEANNPSRKILQSYVKIQATTEKATLFVFAEGEFWFPKSQITVDETKKELILPFWLWDKRQSPAKEGEESASTNSRSNSRSILRVSDMVRELESINTALVEIVKDLVDLDPCDYTEDEDMCITHKLPYPCPHETAKKLLEKLRKEGKI